MNENKILKEVMNRVRDNSFTLNDKQCINIVVVEQLLKDVLYEERTRKRRIVNFWDEEL